MMDIEPWIEDGAPAEVVAALRAARREAPEPQAIERCLAAAAAGAAGVAAFTASGAKMAPAAFGHAGAASGTALTLVKWGAGGLLAGSLYAGGALVVGRATAPLTGARAPITAAGAGAELGKSGVVAPVAPAAAPAPAAGTEASITAHAPRPLAREARGPDAELTEQLALVRHARVALDSGAPAAAMRWLAEYDRRFGDASSLSPEARYLRLDALLADGRREEARSVAREIIARDARGPHVSRARAVLDEK
ncbi:MAG TPA: hypothetical protein VFV94_18810 [Polyangiaceae bacterium]|nr:hypothetical protein [Polyangiaceae bacterium]